MIMCAGSEEQVGRYLHERVCTEIRTDSEGEDGAEEGPFRDVGLEDRPLLHDACTISLGFTIRLGADEPSTDVCDTIKA